MSFFLIPRVSYAAAAVCLAVSALAAAEPPGGARVTLLPAGTRASVVVELDGESPMATAIEATDNQTVAVEIGPVRGKVVNQILQAAERSPLVKQVRVRGLTQGVDGTVLTILIEAKIPVSGSVRRASRRVYIDLEPRDVLSAGARTTTRTPSVADTGRPTPTSAPKPDAAPVRPAPPVVPPPPMRFPAPNENAPATAIAEARPVRTPSAPAIEPARPPAASPTTPPASRATGPAAMPPGSGMVLSTATPSGASNTAPAPGPAVASAAPATDPPSSPVLPAGPPAAEVVSAQATNAATASPVAVVNSTAATGSLEDIQRRVEQLARVPDVKAVQQLKAEVIARRDGLASVGAPTADVNALLARFDRYVSDAQRNQLALDGSLFRGAQAPPSSARASSSPPSEPAAPSRAESAPHSPAPTAQLAPAQSPAPTDRPSQAHTVPPISEQAPAPAPTRAEVPASPPPATVPASPPPATAATSSGGRSTPSPGAGQSALSIPAFRQALKPIKPDLESVAIALGSWSGGALPPANLQGVVASLIARLRAIQPPTEIASAHAGMCTALDALAIMWAKAMVEAPPEGAENAVIERARSAVDEFMRVEGTLAPTTAAR